MVFIYIWCAARLTDVSFKCEATVAFPCSQCLLPGCADVVLGLAGSLPPETKTTVTFLHKKPCLFGAPRQGVAVVR